MAMKHILGGAATVGAGVYAATNGVPEILSNGASMGAGVVEGAAELTNSAVAGVLSSTGVVPGAIASAFLPSLATGVAGEYGMRKLADVLKIEHKTLRNAMRITGAAGGAVAGATLSPAMWYILAGAGIVAAKDVPLYLLGKAGQGVSATWGGASSFVWGGVKGAAKGALNGVKSGWSNPGIKPQVGF